jgi:hypothetical protein
LQTLTAPTAVQPKPAQLAASAVRFYPPLGNRPLLEGRKVVHGYIRSAEYRLSYVDAVRREFAQYCRAHSLHLSLLFIDDGEPCKRHGFLSLCQVLETGEAYGALRSSCTHGTCPPTPYWWPHSPTRSGRPARSC